MVLNTDQNISGNVLEFFNTVHDPYVIRHRIKDDPNFSVPSSSGYGISLSVARKILARRNQLQDRRFVSIKQIDNVLGVGPVTLHNILYSFYSFQVQEDWKDLDLGPNWERDVILSSSSSYPITGTHMSIPAKPVRYYRDSNGRVYLNGCVSSTKKEATDQYEDSIIGLLPIGYRPAYHNIYTVKPAGPATLRVVIVCPDGRIHCPIPLSAFGSFSRVIGINLDGISFRVER